MGLRFCSLASGSSGNCYVVRTDDTALLIDCGISGKRIIEGLGALDLALADIDAILLTHEHSDHIMSIKMMARKAARADVFTTRGTFSGVADKIPKERTSLISGNQSFDVGDIRIESFDLSHDAAEPVGYTFYCGEKRLSIVTDTGVVTDEIYEHIKASDAMILEANHEVDVLRSGPYPYMLQERILGPQGHLSNVAAGELISKVLRERNDTECGGTMHVMLAHISQKNNTPGMAMSTVNNILFENGFFDGEDVVLDVAGPDGPTKEIEV